MNGSLVSNNDTMSANINEPPPNLRSQDQTPPLPSPPLPPCQPHAKRPFTSFSLHEGLQLKNSIEENSIEEKSIAKN